jgi:chaperonin GroEL
VSRAHYDGTKLISNEGLPLTPVMLAEYVPPDSGEDGSVIVGKILEKDTYAFGFDAQSGEYGNMLTKGIIDPTKVVRAALQGAASVAGLLITTEAMVAELPSKHAAAARSPGGGMDF